MANMNMVCALDKNGNAVYITDVTRGSACECVCPGCRKPLVAKQGNVKAWHFAHASKNDSCEYGYESSLHLLAKEILCEVGAIFVPAVWLPFNKAAICIHSEGRFEIVSAETEYRMNDMIPDVWVKGITSDILVEIKVTHGIDDVKLEKIKRLNKAVLEIDLSDVNRNIDKDILERFIRVAVGYSHFYKWREEYRIHFLSVF